VTPAPWEPMLQKLLWPVRWLVNGWNRFFHQPTDMRIVGPFRIAYSWLLLLNALNWLPDLQKWFGPKGMVDLETGKALAGNYRYSILFWADTPERVQLCYWIFVLQIVLLLIGFLPRFQSVCVFVWFASFEHRNLIMFDGQDNLFRVMAFLMIFLPTDRFLAVDQLIFRRPPTGPLPPWPLRLVQIEMCVLYISCVIEKAREGDWTRGEAVYYAARLDDFFGKYWIPEFLFHSIEIGKFLCWAVIVVEILIPLFVWFEPTRRLGILLGLGLHGGLQYGMFIHVFQWLMMTGLMTFCKPKDWVDLQRLYYWLRFKATGQEMPPPPPPVEVEPEEPVEESQPARLPPRLTPPAVGKRPKKPRR
jgi:hypothetical protein